MTRKARGASPRGQLATLKKVLNHIGRYRWLVLLSLALSAATVLLTLVVPVLVGRAIDGIIGARRGALPPGDSWRR